VNVRCWLILGGPEAVVGLPPHRSLGAVGALPSAHIWDPGQWAVWNPSPDVYVTVVLAEVPIGA